MRLTLEQLKAMSIDELWEVWRKGIFPFDKATCDNCVTTHRARYDGCKRPDHTGIIEDARRLGEYGNLKELFRSPERLEELYAIRLFYDHLYPQTIEVSTSSYEGPVYACDDCTFATPDLEEFEGHQASHVRRQTAHKR